MLDVELKTKVNESVAEDFIVATRANGFSCKAEFLRFLIEKELYGCIGQVQVTRKHSSSPGQIKG